MTIGIIIQWYQWVKTGSWNWVDFDLINISFEQDKRLGSYHITLMFMGFGVLFSGLTKKGKQRIDKIVNNLD